MHYFNLIHATTNYNNKLFAQFTVKRRETLKNIRVSINLLYVENKNEHLH